jgi:hypothetical protein
MWAVFVQSVFFCSTEPATGRERMLANTITHEQYNYIDIHAPE